MRRSVGFGFVVLALLAVLGFLSTCLAAEKKAPTVALMWVGNVDERTERVSKDGMATRVATGFLRRMREIAPEVNIIAKHDIASYKEGERLFRQFESEVNGIVFLRSAAAKFLGQANPKVPCFVGSCGDPSALGAVKNLKAPEGKITGVSYHIPYQRRLEMVKALFPAVKRVGLIMQKDRPSSMLDKQGTEEQCRRMGLTYTEVSAGNLKDLIDRTKEILGRVDVLILSNSGLVLDNTVTLVTEANKTKTPIFAYAQRPVTMGAVAALAARDEYLGEQLADSVVDVVVKGRPVSLVPVKMDPNPVLFVNEHMMTTLELKFPASVMKTAEKVE